MRATGFLPTRERSPENFVTMVTQPGIAGCVWNLPVKYWIPVYNILKMTVSIVLIPNVKVSMEENWQEKNAKWIADLFKHDLVAGQLYAARDIRQLRDYALPFQNLTCFQSSEKNRLGTNAHGFQYPVGKRCFQFFGKSAQAILDKLLEKSRRYIFWPRHLFTKVWKSFLNSRDAIDGLYHSEQAGKLKVSNLIMKTWNPGKLRLEELILALAPTSRNAHSPNPVSVATLLPSNHFEIGTYMEAFPSAKHLCS